jgi:hypothetical protein
MGVPALHTVAWHRLTSGELEGTGPVPERT